MSRRILDLSILPWELGQAPRQPFGRAPADDRGAVKEWLPAAVPGDVRADLIAAGRIPPVDSPEGIAAGAWADDSDWWYRTQLPAGFQRDEAVILEADGIDYYSAIWLDDQLLATHAGMFARQNVQLSPGPAPRGPHELAIRVWGGWAFSAQPASIVRRGAGWLAGKLAPGTDYHSQRMATTKAQFGFGWDFSPRLLSAGIWDDARLVTVRGAYIEDMWVDGEPLTDGEDPTPAQWHLRLRLMRWLPGSVRVEIVLRPDNFDGAGYQTLSRSVQLCAENTSPCTADYDFSFDMAAARRWWPWDQGEPCLYRMTVRLFDDGGLLDECSRVAGVRSVRRLALPGGAPWQFVLNGRPVFLRGANWVPADVLPGRVRPADYERLLALARSAGINFLRVWGGGLREKQPFWDLCDRLGLMAWQEFPLACDLVDHYNRDQVYLDTLAREAEGIVRALRNHPSLIAWCGGNEIDVERERLPLQRVASVLAGADPTRPWIPASPGEGDVHQWDVWHHLAHWSDLAMGDAPFMSEFGLQALPDQTTVAQMFPGGAPDSLADRRWAGRMAQVPKIRHYAGLAAADRNLDEAILASQRVQAAALQAGLEGCRIRRETCGGVAFWQFNEPWFAVSWSVVDRAGRTKAAYEMLKRSFQPVLVAARFPRRSYRAGDVLALELWLVNDGVESWRDCTISVVLDGDALWLKSGVQLEPGSVGSLGTVTRLLQSSPSLLSLQVECDGVSLASNCYDLAVFMAGPRPVGARVRSWLVNRMLK